MAKSVSTFEPHITSLDEYTEPANVMIYGDAGSGKTGLAATLEKALIVPTDHGGIITARRFGGPGIKVYPRLRTGTDVRNFMLWVRKQTFDPDYWLVIDTLTEFQMILWAGILAAEAKQNHSRDLDTAQIQDYGKGQNLFKRYVKALNDLPVNVLYTAHAMKVEDEDGDPLLLPDFYGKNGTDDPTTMARWVAAAMHTVGYLKVIEGPKGKADTRRLIGKRSGAYTAKDRYDVIVPYSDNPKMADIAKGIKDSLAGKTSAAAPRTRRTRNAAPTDSAEKGE